MSGQDACLSIKEAKAQQERICAHESHQGEKSKPTAMKDTEVMKKQK